MPGALMDINLAMRDHHLGSQNLGEKVVYHPLCSYNLGDKEGWADSLSGKFLHPGCFSCMRDFAEDCLVARLATAYSIARHALKWCRVEVYLVQYCCCGLASTE